MSKYTTGEMAKFCGVSVRTIQYYDAKGILTPSQRSEGGRRLYSDEDLGTLNVICFLRSIDMPIDVIKNLLNDNNSMEVISILLQQQVQVLQKEAAECSRKLDALNQLIEESKNLKSFSVKSMQDITFIMKRKKGLHKVHVTMLFLGIAMDILFACSVLLWIFYAVWVPFVICFPIVIAIGIWTTKMYYKKTLYLCPACYKIFKPRMKEFLFSAHTPRTRKLSCINCGHKGFCVETFDETEMKK